MRALLILPLLAACAAAPPPAGLDGTWRLARLAGEEVPPTPRPAELRLLPEGRFGATAGCNRVAGAYEAAGEALSFRPGAAMTRMACLPDLQRREAALLVLLRDAARGRMGGDVLIVSDRAGTELAVLRKVMPPGG